MNGLLKDHYSLIDGLEYIWPTFSWICFLVCFLWGWATRKTVGTVRGQKGSSSHFLAHTHFGWSADSPHWHEAATKPTTSQPFPWIILQPFQLLSQVFVFSSVTQRPSFCRRALIPSSEVTKTDTAFSPSLWLSAFSWSPPLYIHHPFLTGLHHRLQVPTLDTGTTTL